MNKKAFDKLLTHRSAEIVERVSRSLSPSLSSRSDGRSSAKRESNKQAARQVAPDRDRGRGGQGGEFDSSVWRCSECGKQFFLPARCCGRATKQAPAALLFAVESSVSARDGLVDGFSVIILTRGNASLTRKAVESLAVAARTSKAAVEFVFVDNGSKDDTFAFIRDLSRKGSVKLLNVPEDEPFVYARNCNRGAQQASGKHLIFANNDIQVQDPTLFSKLRLALDDAVVGAVGTLTNWHAGNALHAAKSLPADYVFSEKPVMGHLWAVRSDVYWELAGQDEQFDGYGCDEVDFQFRLLLRNYRIAMVNAYVHHQGRATYGQGDQVTARHRLNMLKFEVKHGAHPRRPSDFHLFAVHRYPEISIMVTAHNLAVGLRRCLDSILACANPTPAGLQVVVVDNASTDESPALLSTYQRNHPGVFNVIRLPRRRGPAMAKNVGLKRCVGRYVVLLEADEEILPQKLVRCYQVLESTDAQAVYHDYYTVLQTGAMRYNRLGASVHPDGQNGGRVPLSACMFRKGAVSFNEQALVADDGDFLSRRWDNLRPEYLPEALSQCHRHPRSRHMRLDYQAALRRLQGNASPRIRDEEVFISIVIPCYGRQELFQDTLWSCLEQRSHYADFEIIVVDDASPQPIQLPYAFERIRLVRLPENRGESYARNLGVALARGRYVKFMDSDDLLLDRSSLQRFAEAAIIAGDDVIYCRTLWLDVATARMGTWDCPDLGDPIYRRNWITPSQLLVKKAVLTRVPFAECIRDAEDWHWLKDLYGRKEYSFRKIDDALVVNRVTPQSQQVERNKDFSRSFATRLEAHRKAGGGWR